MLTGLGIRHVGGIVADTLVRHFGSIDALAAATAEELQAVEGIGPAIAQAVVDWFSRPRNRRVIEKLRRAGVRLEEEVVEAGPQPLAGLTFVITGTLSRPRQQVAEMIEGWGGKVTGSVSARTSYLVVGESPGGTKFRRAQELGVPVIDEAALMALAGGAKQPPLPLE